MTKCLILNGLCGVYGILTRTDQQSYSFKAYIQHLV